jgi:CheY-like chemotaxis protein
MPQPSTRGPAPAAPSARPLRVLIVDDNRSVVESLKMLLDLKGNLTHVAFDGLEAIELARLVKPAVILLDIGLPKIDGWETCRRIRQQPWGRDITVCALTARGQDDDRLKSQEAGFDMHFVKPLDPEFLLTVLEAARLNQRPH